jgi:hypothetical protein
MYQTTGYPIDLDLRRADRARRARRRRPLLWLGSRGARWRHE